MEGRDMMIKEIRIELAKRRVSRIQLCHSAKISRFRLYQAERGFVELTPNELTAIREFFETSEFTEVG
jgi:hypothetical protein